LLVMGVPVKLDLLQSLRELLRGQRGEQHATHRGDERGQPRSDRQRDRHDPPRRHAHDVDDVGVVEHRHRGGLVQLVHERLHVRLGDLGEAEAGQVRVAEVEHTRAQREAPVLETHVAELDQRQQEAAGGGPGQTGGRRDVGEAQVAVLGVEGADDRQAALERLDEV
jgi:hypothetical protein